MCTQKMRWFLIAYLSTPTCKFLQFVSEDVSFILQASALAAAANAEELVAINRKLKSSDEELDLVNKRFDETQGMRHFYIPEVICVLIL